MDRVSISLKSNRAYEEIPMAVSSAKRLSPIIPLGHPPSCLKTQAENQDKDAEDNGASKRHLPLSQMLVWEVSCCDQLSHLGSFHCGHFQSCNLRDHTKRLQLAALLTPRACRPRDLAVLRGAGDGLPASVTRPAQPAVSVMTGQRGCCRVCVQCVAPAGLGNSTRRFKAGA